MSVFSEQNAARRIYELERELPERNFAKGHSFTEWFAHNYGTPEVECHADADEKEQ